MNRVRESWVDVLKGIAICFVVIGHNSADTAFWYCFHMPLFFMLSGFIFSPKTVTTYCYKSTLRLLIPYISFLIVISVPEVLSIIRHDNIFGGGKMLLVKLLFGGTHLVGVYAVFWFVTTLWCATNLFNLILSRHIGYWLLSCLIFLGYCCQFLPFSLPWNLQVVPMAISYIWIGFIINKSLIPEIKRWENLPPPWICLSIVFLILLIVFMFRKDLRIDMKYNYYGLPIVSFFSSILASVSMAVIAIYLSKASIITKILVFIGECSMVIMYLHMPIKYILLSRIGLSENYPACIIAGLTISMGAYLLFKENKLTRNLFLGA